MADNEEVTKRIDEQLARYEDLSEAVEEVGHELREQLERVEAKLIQIEGALRRLEEG